MFTETVDTDPEGILKKNLRLLNTARANQCLISVPKYLRKTT